MADIRSTAAEIRRGKKEEDGRRKKEEGKKLQGKNIMAPLLHRAAITIFVRCTITVRPIKSGVVSCSLNAVYCMAVASRQCFCEDTRCYGQLVSFCFQKALAAANCK